MHFQTWIFPFSRQMSFVFITADGMRAWLKLWKMSNSPPSTDMEAFRKLVKKAKNVVILTGVLSAFNWTKAVNQNHFYRFFYLGGAGVSAESGVPTFRGAGGYWRTYNATDLATPSAFRSNPSLVWEVKLLIFIIYYTVIYTASNSSFITTGEKIWHQNRRIM